MNKVILMGRLTRDPEARYTQTNNTVVSTFSLAVNRRFARQGEERQADFINIVAWSKLAEFCNKYFKKGQQVGIIGRIQTRTWDDDKGVKHYVTEVIAEEAYFADSRRDGDSSTSSFENTFGTSFGAGAPVDSASDFDVSASDDLPF
ncbi:MAG: single-stranded DNA-binding protein [Clostridia bacterium]|nr:single-stranded DNA-binding protein [Clostridia bacterium]